MKLGRRFRALADFRLGFGEHRNKRLAQVPRDYLTWLISTKSPDLSADRWATEQFLNACRGQQRAANGKRPRCRRRRIERRHGASSP